jgi:HPt (histidine-containing phosphotransfer) domain-containing protein
MQTEIHPTPTVLESIIDLELIDELTGGDAEFLAELVEVYTETVPGQVEAVHDAVAGRDPDGIMRAAHHLKGTLANFGTKSAYAAALKVEMMGRQARLEGVQSAVEDLIREVHLLTQTLQTL